MKRLAISAVALAVIAPALTISGLSTAEGVDEVNSKRLREAVTVGGIMGHERVLQRVANQNGGTRASGTPGYDASAEYVKHPHAAGYRVSEQEFTFPFFRELAPADPRPGLADAGDLRDRDVRLLRQRRRHWHVVPTNDVLVPPTADARFVRSGCEAWRLRAGAGRARSR